jgi:ubiquinone/menaquinone biosynthesis C-methylase UbiE
MAPTKMDSIKRKLNLGCGKKIMEGYINLDHVSLAGVDIVHDINKFPYPFEDNSFVEVYANSVLEHVDDLPRVMKELHRILEAGGRLVGGVPWFNCSSAYGDPTHKYFFTLQTFLYFDASSPYFYESNGGKWKVISLDVTPTKYGRWIPFKKKLLWRVGHFIGEMVHKIEFELKTVKQ